MPSLANAIGAGADLQAIVSGYGVRTPFGMLEGPGGKVASYVRSIGAQSDDDPVILAKLDTTLAAALAKCRSGLGDTIIVLPGHSESVADALMLTNLVAGTKIIGVGIGSNQPVFRFTATGAQWAINKADVTIAGMYFRCEGANGVVLPFALTGADCRFYGNRVQVASGATAKATTVFDCQAGSGGFDISANVFFGTATHNVTDGIKVSSAVSNGRICDNEAIFSATAGNGNMHVTAAALNLKVLRNYLYNTHTASTACIALDDVAADGLIADNYVATTVGTATAPTAAGIVLAGVTTLFRFFQNYSTPTKNTSGIVCPVVDS